MVAIIGTVAPAVAVGAPSVVKMKTYATNYTLKSNTSSTADTSFHIIDHGSVLYLILMQILLYDQQYVLSCAAVTTNMICNTAAPIITKISSANYDEDSSAVTTMTTAIIMMTTVFHELPSTIQDGIFSAVADVVMRTTTSYTLPSYDVDSSSSTIYNKDSSADSSSSTIYDKDSSADSSSSTTITNKA